MSNNAKDTQNIKNDAYNVIPNINKKIKVVKVI